MRFLAVLLVAALAVAVTAAPVVESESDAAQAGQVKPLNCPCGPGKRDPWHPGCLKKRTKFYLPMGSF
ncbi:hypothetical protein BGW38_008206 [Lunasporangiospora selenospora]|uniref:Uncharacterized protein n=1 Tax=Lunasporangiospora selenospora TaxID=979761 RepID=A0A9P6FKK7_9FUNG|nr:hypothetical protein BGW38_008206 [Lunasporangiospora selenospora]